MRRWQKALITVAVLVLVLILVLAGTGVWLVRRPGPASRARSPCPDWRRPSR
jgi:hypothetical protein